MIDINELRRLAQAALIAPGSLSPEWMDRLGQFQEAADPSAISELLDRLEAAEKKRDDLLACLGEWLDKTEWVQQGVTEGMISAKYLGLHRADVMASLLGEAEKERDVLKAKIKAMEQQKPVAFALYSGWARKAVYLSEIEACEQRDRRQLTADLGGSLEAYRVAPLYALPGAQPAPSVPDEIKRDVLRACCGTFHGSRHRITCERYKGKKAPEAKP